MQKYQNCCTRLFLYGLWLSKRFPAENNFWRRHFLCGPCRRKGNETIYSSQNLLFTGFLVLMSASMKITPTVYWGMTPCILIEGYWCFGGTLAVGCLTGFLFVIENWGNTLHRNVCKFLHSVTCQKIIYHFLNWIRCIFSSISFFALILYDHAVGEIVQWFLKVDM
jgi:hypothetical protein